VSLSSRETFLPDPDSYSTPTCRLAAGVGWSPPARREFVTDHHYPVGDHAGGDHSTTAIVRAAPHPAYERAKRMGDLCFATLAILFLLPILLLVALAIFIEDPGPVLFSHVRIGKGGRPFRFFKFRSMVRNAELLKERLADANEATGPIFKMRRDPRVTRVGRLLRRYSLDELPQFLNVLRGEMTLVGPRPHVPSEVERYTEQQWERLAVPSGLICLREISGRSELTFDQWIDLDLEYIRTRSLKTDLRILLGAVPAVLSGRGAY
jgi:lipopolysaccharide/colanic/teichoic acid biosynthesis glycosyltransferase